LRRCSHYVALAQERLVVDLRALRGEAQRGVGSNLGDQASIEGEIQVVRKQLRNLKVKQEAELVDIVSVHVC
jgi:hypothetical protein